MDTNASAFPGTVATNAFGGYDDGTVDWVNPNNIKLDDGNYSTVTRSSVGSGYSYLIKASNFGFSIPTNATILGIEVIVQRKANNDTTGVAYDWGVKALKAGSDAGNDLSVGGNWATSDTTIVYGGPTNLLGTTWTPSDINNSGFGARMQVRLDDISSSVTAYIDYVSIKVYYFLPIPEVSLDDLNNPTDTSILATGSVTTDNGYPTTARGFCINTTGSPTTADTVFTPTGDDDRFDALINGLTLGTKYHIRAFATNTNGTAYSDEQTYTPALPIPKSHLYKIYTKDGDYMGNLPNVTSEFMVPLEINTAGSQINVTCGISPDVVTLDVSPLLDETGATLLDETGEVLLEEQAPNVIGPGTLINEGNTLKVYEYSTYYPNGKLRFSGQIELVDAGFDGSNQIDIIASSDGSDLQNHIIDGGTYIADASHATGTSQQNTSDYGGTIAGQTWTTGSVSNLGAIDLEIQNDDSVDITVSIYISQGAPPALGFPATILGSMSRVIPASTGKTVYRFASATPITVVPSTLYFFSVQISSPSGHVVKVSYDNSNSYANGQMYLGTGVSPFVFAAQATKDLYFKTYSVTVGTTAIYTNTDPSDMVRTALDGYGNQGGLISYNALTIENTGYSADFNFVTNTVKEVIDKAMQLGPANFYYFVDLSTNLLNYKQLSSTPDFVLVRGVHIQEMRLVSNIQSLANIEYFTGGDIGGGVNLYRTLEDADSLAQYRDAINRQSDGRVSVNATADTLMRNDLARHSGKQYQTTVTILDTVMDITKLLPGKTIKLAGYGQLVGSLLLSIVRAEYYADRAIVTIGTLPPRLAHTVQQALIDLQVLQNIDTPSAPS